VGRHVRFDSGFRAIWKRRARGEMLAAGTDVKARPVTSPSSGVTGALMVASAASHSSTAAS